MDRRRRRVLALLNIIAKQGISKRDKILSEFAITQGLEQRKVEGYCSQLIQAEKLEERVQDGIPMLGTVDAWTENDKMTITGKRGIPR